MAKIIFLAIIEKARRNDVCVAWLGRGTLSSRRILIQTAGIDHPLASMSNSGRLACPSSATHPTMAFRANTACQQARFHFSRLILTAQKGSNQLKLSPACPSRFEVCPTGHKKPRVFDPQRSMCATRAPPAKPPTPHSSVNYDLNLLI